MSDQPIYLVVTVQPTDAWTSQTPEEARKWLENFVAVQREQLLTSGIVASSMVEGSNGDYISMIWILNDPAAPAVIRELMERDDVKRYFRFSFITVATQAMSQEDVWDPFFRVLK